MISDIALAYLSLLLEGAPFILLGTVFSGFLDIYMPPGLLERTLPKRKGLAIITAGALGLILPVCECAVVPVIRRLMQKGLPVSCALTYMLAAPIVNPITALSTWKAFPDTMLFDGRALFFTGSRLALGYIIAVGFGFLLLTIRPERYLNPKLIKAKKNGHHHHNTPHKLTAALRISLRDFAEVSLYFSIGILITSLFNVGIAPGVTELKTLAGNNYLAIPALMLVAFLLSLCSTSDAFIAATLGKFGIASRLAFMVFGPMMDIKLVFLYQSIFKNRAIIYLGLSLFITIGALCLGWEHIWLSISK